MERCRRRCGSRLEGLGGRDWSLKQTDSLRDVQLSLRHSHDCIRESTRRDVPSGELITVLLNSERRQASAMGFPCFGDRLLLPMWVHSHPIALP